MNKFLKKFATYSLPCLCLALPFRAHAWTTLIDCEGGSINTAPASTNSILWGTNTSRYSNEQVGTGKQSCKLSIQKGGEGWPSAGGPMEFGAIVQFPTPVAVGQEVWIRLSLFVPVGFQIETNSGMLKFIRMHTRTSTTNNGCLDFLFGAGLPLWDSLLKKDMYPQHVLNWEGAPGLTMIGYVNKSPVAKGTWETYEVNVKLDTVSKANGGTGEVRAWKNNKLIADVTTQVSAANSTGVMDSLYLFTYWNGNSPQTQSVYVDDLTITTDRPSNRDAAGNAFIGAPAMSGAAPAPSTTPAAPKAPTGVSATPI